MKIAINGTVQNCVLTIPLPNTTDVSNTLNDMKFNSLTLCKAELKTIVGNSLMKLTERMPKVCKPAIKEKSGFDSSF